MASRVDTAEATRDWALAELERARLKYKSEINGVNTTVASLEAQLQQSRYYLDNVCAAPGDRDQRFRLIATTDSGTPWGGGKKNQARFRLILPGCIYQARITKLEYLILNQAFYHRRR